MPKPPEEKEADDRLTAAIENWLRVNKFDGSAEDDGIPRVLTDYLVFTATQGWKPDGESVTGHPLVFREDSMPLYRAIGLARLGLVILEKMMDDDEESG